ncbi:hypothetical protein F2P81_003169 [Scophthalmus maximus]|uniref:Uncharacterized protein n=1 Tax=Scophthalmus maximus TaxID=52904 RepID=A0A6A4TMF9_SCOMX|nr:hypothetical protein F2P81_003169 [Scophthalmus maximus]
MPDMLIRFARSFVRLKVQLRKKVTANKATFLHFLVFGTDQTNMLQRVHWWTLGVGELHMILFTFNSAIYTQLPTKKFTIDSHYSVHTVIEGGVPVPVPVPVPGPVGSIWAGPGSTLHRPCDPRWAVFWLRDKTQEV